MLVFLFFGAEGLLEVDIQAVAKVDEQPKDIGGFFLKVMDFGVFISCHADCFARGFGEFPGLFQ